MIFLWNAPFSWQIYMPNDREWQKQFGFYNRLSFNSLAPGKFEWNFRYVLFNWILRIDGWWLSCEIALIWMSFVFTDDQSTLVHVMAWCRQATSHYVSQCWPGSLYPYGVTGPQWVKLIHWPLRHVNAFQNVLFWYTLYWLIFWPFLVNCPHGNAIDQFHRCRRP